MTTLQQLMQNNAEWADRVQREDPTFFDRLSKQQRIIQPVYRGPRFQTQEYPSDERLINSDQGEGSRRGIGSSLSNLLQFLQPREQQWFPRDPPFEKRWPF